ncbi:MAG: hypothetical protein KJN84_09275 [Bacteroidia bacterium]|nr:hypothetical protein [Bacteroidia bacterium]
MLSRLSFLVLFSLMLFSCNQDKKCVQPINPNGDSELALLMREMFDNSMAVKTEFLKNHEIKELKKFDDMKSAEATEPEKAKSDLYAAMADSYLASVETVNKALSENYIDTYNGMVENCMACHKTMCPGPMVKIKKLYIE